jgi:hypothetical protein
MIQSLKLLFWFSLAGVLIAQALTGPSEKAVVGALIVLGVPALILTFLDRGRRTDRRSGSPSTGSSPAPPTAEATSAESPQQSLLQQYRRRF